MRKLAVLAALSLTLTACGGDATPQPESKPVLKVSVNPASPQVGQKMTFNVSLTGGLGTWHVALFNENPDGSIDQIYPNRLPDGQPTLTPGATLSFPPPNAAYFALAAEPLGLNTLVVYAAQKPVNPEEAGLSHYADAQAQFAEVERQDIVNGSFIPKLNLLYQGIFAYASYEIFSAQPVPAP